MPSRPLPTRRLFIREAHRPSIVQLHNGRALSSKIKVLVCLEDRDICSRGTGRAGGFMRVGCDAA
jgi:hypothetical protein